MRSRKWRRIGGLVALSLSALGCDRAEQKAATGPVTLTWLISTEPQRTVTEGIVADFERANPDVHVDVRWTPEPQYQTKLKTLIAAGQSPDLFWCGDVWVAYLRPFLYDLTPLVERDAAEIGLDDVYPTLRRACQYGGRWYYLPRFFNVSLLYYNRGLFDAAGVPYPTPAWTWDDYVAAGQKLTRRGPDGHVDSWGSTIVTGWWGEWHILVRQAGGRLFDPAVTRCELDSPAAERGMRFYADKVFRYGISPPPGYGPANGFASGRYAMEFGGHTGNWPVFDAVPGLGWDVQVLPRGPTGRAGGEVAADAVGVARTCAHPEAAWRFLKYLTGRESIARYVAAGTLSPRRSVAEDRMAHRRPGDGPANMRAAYDALADAEPLPASADFVEVALDVIQPEVDRVLADGVPVDVGCRRAAAAADDFIATVGGR